MYIYYHCKSSCGARFRAEYVNAEFEKELRKFVPHPAAVELYKQVIKDTYESNVKDGRKERRDILQQMTQVKDRAAKARDLLLASHIDAQDYHTIKTDCEKQMTVLEAKLSDTSQQKGDITDILEKAINNLSNLDKIYKATDVVKKRKMVGIIFPEYMTFNGHMFRTTKLNEAVQLIYSMDKAFQQKENETSGLETNLSHLVIPLGIESWEITKILYLSVERQPSHSIFFSIAKLLSEYQSNKGGFLSQAA